MMNKEECNIKSIFDYKEELGNLLVQRVINYNYIKQSEFAIKHIDEKIDKIIKAYQIDSEDDLKLKEEKEKKDGCTVQQA